MIAHLEGVIRAKSPEAIILDVHGVGYCVAVPLSTFYGLPSPGKPACLHVHTHVREDALQLFGFATLAEKEMFLHLLQVSRIGPKMALNILSGISASDLRQAVATEHRERLGKIPGVGRKTADRIILELRDRLRLGNGASPEGVPLPECPCEGPFADALSALVNLGYKPADAEKALKEAASRLGEDPPVEDLLRETLRGLGQGAPGAPAASGGRPPRRGKR